MLLCRTLVGLSQCENQVFSVHVYETKKVFKNISFYFLCSFFLELLNWMLVFLDPSISFSFLLISVFILLLCFGIFPCLFKKLLYLEKVSSAIVFPISKSIFLFFHSIMFFCINEIFWNLCYNTYQILNHLFFCFLNNLFSLGTILVFFFHAAGFSLIRESSFL